MFLNIEGGVACGKQNDTKTRELPQKWPPHPNANLLPSQKQG